MIVTLLTDYGRDDDFVGVCHGVIRRIAPEAQIVDITHGIARYAVRQGALVLRNTLPYMPAGVHVAIVDPQVGTERRALALRCARRPPAGRARQRRCSAWPGRRAGASSAAVDITRSPHRLEPVSATFHGRDVFAPVAAHLAAGAELVDAGEAVDPDTLADGRAARRRGSRTDALVAHALVIDRFGNVGLNVGHEELAGTGLKLGEQVELEVGRRALPRHVRADLRRRQARRADRLRGRLPHPRGGDQPRRRRRHARARARRRGAAAAAMSAPARAGPAPAPAPDRLDQRAGEGAGPRRAPRTGRS